MSKKNQELIGIIAHQKKHLILAVMQFMELPTTERFFTLIDLACEMVSAYKLHSYHYKMSILSGQVGIHEIDEKEADSMPK